MQRQETTRAFAVTGLQHVLWSIVLCLASGACCVWLLMTSCTDEAQERADTREAAFVRRDLLFLGSFVMSKILFDEVHPFAVPEGNVTSLEAWLEQQRASYRARGEAHEDAFWALLHVKRKLAWDAESSAFRLVDRWGKRLVYLGPAEDPALVFTLYSVGKNGRDEHGKGDDVDASQPYARYRGHFEDPNFDGTLYREHRGRLKLIRRDRKARIAYPTDGR